jgi:hypothetical protein
MKSRVSDQGKLTIMPSLIRDRFHDFTALQRLHIFYGLPARRQWRLNPKIIACCHGIGVRDAWPRRPLLNPPAPGGRAGKQ